MIREARPEDIWISAAGIVGDWQLTDITAEFSKQRPDLLPTEIDRPEVALFDTPFSQVVKIMNFILKGRTQDVMRCVKIFTRIESPEELLNGMTSQAKYILKKLIVITY